MASENQVRTYIKNNYNTLENDFGAMKFEFELAGGRTQLVFAWINDTNIQVSSPFATTDKITPLVALEAVSKRSLGMQLLGDLYTVRYYAPIADIDESEIIAALELTAVMADSLEQELLGSDNL